jgi:hypothetical protein
MKINHEIHERHEIIGHTLNLSFVPFVVKYSENNFFLCALAPLREKFRELDAGHWFGKWSKQN